jgi:outer membrane protein OmpA-like peptidoglycan-associated protein
MKKCVLLLTAVYALTSLSCAKGRNVIVLLPDADGKTGQVIVSNKKGTLLLKDPRQATELISGDTAPSIPFVMEETQIREKFGEALSVLPEPPTHFTLYFMTGSTRLTSESEKVLEKVLPAVEGRKSTDVSIVGHTDRVGTRQANLALGADRALLVKKILVLRGMSPEIVEVASHGEDNPLIPTADEVKEPLNRRVVVIVR